MRLGIDASNLRAGGGVTHLVEVLRAADPRKHGFDGVTVWGGGATLSKVEARDWLDKAHVAALDGPLIRRLLWQRFSLKGHAFKAGCDVLWVPGGADASGFRPIVTMSRNMLPFEWREMRRYGLSLGLLRLLLLRTSQTRTLRRAEGVIFLTRYAREAVMRHVVRTAGETALVAHGVDERFFHAPRRPRDAAKFTASDPCRLLYVSSVDMYKHQWHVAEATARLRAGGVAVALDIVGSAYAPALARLRRVLSRVDPVAGFIRYLGEIPYERLHSLYAAADIAVFASSCENMPNILLESMASGLPIACSNRGPMPEVLGDAGVYFDPERPEDIARAVGELIHAPEMRVGLAGAALERARGFSWRRCANETFAFIASTAAAHGTRS